MPLATPVEIAAEPPEQTLLVDNRFRHTSWLIVLGFFGVQLSNPNFLAKLSFQHLLKDELHVTAGTMSMFFLITGLPWYCKPIAGILADAFPFFGTRRRHYILLSTAFAGACWIGIALLPHSYELLIGGVVVLNCFLVMCSTVLGGFLVESGQRQQATGRLTAARMYGTYAAVLLMGRFGGWLAKHYELSATALVSAGLILLVFPLAYFLLRERPQHGPNLEALHNAKQQLKAIGRSKMLWWAMIFVGLFYFAPGFNTPLYYLQTDALKLDKVFIGDLGMLSGAGMILGAILYGFLARRVSLSVLVASGITISALCALLYLFYSTPGRAMAIDFTYGFGFALAEVCLLDLCARSTPKGCEALGFALIVSVTNLTSQAADQIGSRLIDAHWTFPNLVLVNAGTSLLVLVLLPFLPKQLLRTRDG